MKVITIEEAIDCMNENMAKKERKTKKIFSFGEFLEIMRKDPGVVFRTTPGILKDLVLAKTAKKPETNPDDPEAIGYTGYDCSKLLEEGHAQPFYADTMFSHVLVEEIEALGKSSRQNRIYVIEGPHGCGKSTFLKNLLANLQDYVNEDPVFEVFWKIEGENLDFLKKKTCLSSSACEGGSKKENDPILIGDCLEIPCPGHDKPILVIPKKYRANFLKKIITDEEWRQRIFNEKRYEWVLNKDACPVCQSIFNALYERFDNNLEKVLEMLKVRYYIFNRTMGQGIKVLRSGDEPSRKNIVTNEMLQRRITNLFGDSHVVRYRFSKQAQANNGIIVLEDIKNFNVTRFLGCHNLVSEGAQSVGEDIEEEINCLFIALMNPEDKDKDGVGDVASLQDRITFVKVGYPTDVETEAKIYKSVFGGDVWKNFLPKMLEYFARIVISTRFPKEEKSVKDENSEYKYLWGLISKKEFASDYGEHCDVDGLIFLMEISYGKLPEWVLEKHRDKFKAKVRRKILDIIKKSGDIGYSVREAISMLDSFISYHSRVGEHLINIDDVISFFKKLPKTTRDYIPKDFLASILKIYNKEVTEELKEALFYSSEKEIEKNIRQYIFAINFSVGEKKMCVFTDEEIEITKDFFELVETALLGKVPENERIKFRSKTQKEYITYTLAQEIRNEGKKLEETELYAQLYERYMSKLKVHALDHWIESDNFRQAILDHGKPEFKNYGDRVRKYADLMMKNLTEKFGYTTKGAKDIAIYVLDLYRKK